MGRVGNGGNAMAGISGAEKVIVRVNASPAFALPGSGFHDSTAVRSLALRTVPSFSAPGGNFAAKCIGSVLTVADTLFESMGWSLKLNRTVKDGIVHSPGRCAKTETSCRCTA